MLSQITNFLKLSFTEKLFFFEAFVALGVMRAAILTISFKRLSRSLKQQKQYDLILLSSESYVLAQAVQKGIKQAANHTPWESACLAQSLTARWMLQRRGVPGALYLGINKGASSKNKIGHMKAHAWSQCGEVIVTGEQGIENFTVVSVFVWEK